MIYVGNVAEMKRIESFDDRLEIGAATPSPTATRAAEYPDFGDLLHRFASLQIRNQGTLGGNIGNASPIGDSPPLLIALGAQVVLCKGETRRTLALEDYFIDYRVTARQEASSSRRSSCPRHGRARSAPTRSPSAWTMTSPPCAPPSTCASKTAWSPTHAWPSAAWPRSPNAPRLRSRAARQPFNNATVERACAALAEDFTRSRTSAPARNIACSARRTCCANTSSNCKRRTSRLG
jgi:xanthine dehydrogenase small subunit